MSAPFFFFPFLSWFFLSAFFVFVFFLGWLLKNRQIFPFQVSAPFFFFPFLSWIYFLLLHLRSFMFLLSYTFMYKAKRRLYYANIRRSSNSLPAVEMWTPYWADQAYPHPHILHVYDSIQYYLPNHLQFSQMGSSLPYRLSFQNFMQFFSILCLLHGYIFIFIFLLLPLLLDLTSLNDASLNVGSNI